MTHIERGRQQRRTKKKQTKIACYQIIFKNHKTYSYGKQAGRQAREGGGGGGKKGKRNIISAP